MNFWTHLHFIVFPLSIFFLIRISCLRAKRDFLKDNGFFFCTFPLVFHTLNGKIGWKPNVSEYIFYSMNRNFKIKNIILNPSRIHQVH